MQISLGKSTYKLDYEILKEGGPSAIRSTEIQIKRIKHKIKPPNREKKGLGKMMTDKNNLC